MRFEVRVIEYTPNEAKNYKDSATIYSQYFESVDLPALATFLNKQEE